MIQAYATEYNAIRGFRRNFAHLASLSNDTIRMDVVNVEAGKHTISLDMVAEIEADTFGETKTQRIEGVPALRRTVGNAKGATVRVREFFSSLPAGIARRDAIAAAVDAGFAYATARTQYQNWLRG